MRKHIQEECTNTRCMNATIDCIILVMKLKLNMPLKFINKIIDYVDCKLNDYIL